MDNAIHWDGESGPQQLCPSSEPIYFAPLIFIQLKIQIWILFFALHQIECPLKDTIWIRKQIRLSQNSNLFSFFKRLPIQNVWIHLDSSCATKSNCLMIVILDLKGNFELRESACQGASLLPLASHEGDFILLQQAVASQKPQLTHAWF